MTDARPRPMRRAHDGSEKHGASRRREPAWFFHVTRQLTLAARPRISIAGGSSWTMYAWNQKANEIFISAIQIAEDAERTRLLDGLCNCDSTLRAQVDALLRAHSHAEGFLEAPLAPPDWIDDGLADDAGAIIGSYKLLERIGEGGFGVVYMAEQQVPVRRRVAVKIIKPGMDTRQVIARFEAERQALAMMDHPHIAGALDAGETRSGRPYFVMELVRGVPITTYCDQCKASIRERLELFVLVCQAVQHAAPEGNYSPRHQAVEHSGDAVRRPAHAEDYRLRRGQGDQPATDRADRLYPVCRHGRHAVVHESRAGRDERARRRHAQRRLLSGDCAVRTVDGRAAIRAVAIERDPLRRNPSHHPRRRARQTEHAIEHARKCRQHDRRTPTVRSPPAQPARPRRPGLDRDEVARKGPHAPL